MNYNVIKVEVTFYIFLFTHMAPRQFLIWGGIILVVVAILGWINVLGPTSDSSIFGSTWWFDSVENWAHLIIGIVALLAAFVLPAGAQKVLVIIVGIVGLLFAIFNLAGTVVIGGANLESPLDLILHLVVGIWALWAGFSKKGSAAVPQM